MWAKLWPVVEGNVSALNQYGLLNWKTIHNVVTLDIVFFSLVKYFHYKTF